MFSLSFHDSFIKAKDGLLAPQLFLELISTQYNGYLRIYTDGSHTQSPPSSPAAIYSEYLSISKVWRLDGRHSVVTAELFALLGALSFIKDTLTPQPIAIFSDSQSALSLLSTFCPTTHRQLVFEFHSMLSSLYTLGYVLRFQWIPSHVGIRGNRIVDSAATMAHSSPDMVHCPFDSRRFSQLVMNTCRSLWNESISYDLSRTTLGMYRTDSTPQPWVRSNHRALDAVMVRLRIGHVELAAHLYRLHLVPSPYCKWCISQEESVEHFLLQCPRFYSLRTILSNCLSTLGVQILTLPVLLSGHGLSEDVREKALKFTFDFLRHSGRFRHV